MKRLFIFLAFAFLFLPQIQGVILDNGTSLHTSETNLTINFTQTAYANNVTIESNSIKFSEFSNKQDYDSISFNLTNSNTTYFQYDLPFFSSSSNSEKHISSNLTIISPVLYLDVSSCQSISFIRYISANSVYDKNYDRRGFRCNSNTAILNVDGLEESFGGNILLIEYGCGVFARTGSLLIMIFASLLIISGLIYFIWSSYQEGEIDVGKLITLFIVVMVSLGLWLASGQNLGASCGAI